MAAERATIEPESGESNSRLRSAAIVAVVLAVVLISTLVFRSAITDDEAQEPAEPTPVVTSVATPGPTPEPTAIVPRPEAPVPPLVAREVIDAAFAVERAPLGTFVVAKPLGGLPTQLPPGPDGQVPLEIPVHDEPFGPARLLVYEDIFKQISASHPLIHGGVDSPPLVLRVLAGGPDDEWIQVQAPVFPHHQSVWVQSLYFDFGFTSKRIEIDLAADGHLRMIDGGAIMVDAPITQGGPRASTPIGATYVTGSGFGDERSAFGAGSVRIDLASFREIPGLPSDDMARVVLYSSAEDEVPDTTGDVRLTGDVLADLVQRVGPGTPVLIFNSARTWSRVEEVTTRPLSPATTTDFGDNTLARAASADLVDDQVWELCAARVGLLCAVERGYQPATEVPVGNVFLIATAAAGQEIVDRSDVVPVYDEPGGPKRMLVDLNRIDGVELAYPMYQTTPFGQPLVLRVLQGAPGDEWLLVQAPVRPHRQSTWVRADGFIWSQTLKRIEVDLGRDGLVTLFDGGDEVISSVAVYGRDSRPTTQHDTYVEQVIEGERLSPAYGTYVFTLASYSEALGTFGGGGMPGQSLHGTNQPDLIGQRVSSGGIRVPNEVIEFMYLQPGVVGANAIIFDSSGIGREAAIRLQRFQTWFPARTTTFPLTGLPVAVSISYS